MNLQATITAIKQALNGEMKDALPLLAFLDHLDKNEVKNVMWEVVEKEGTLSISIYPVKDNALPIFFFYRNMESTKMRKNAWLQLSYGPYNILSENGQQTIYRDEANKLGGYITSMLAAKLTQKEYYLDDTIYRQDLRFDYSVNGHPKSDVFTKKLKRKPLFRSYQRVKEKTLAPLVLKKDEK